MKVKISPNHSETQNLPPGVPKSSVLQPSLFLIFINDLPNYVKSEIKLFARAFKLLVWSLLKEIIQIDLYK